MKGGTGAALLAYHLDRALGDEVVRPVREPYPPPPTDFAPPLSRPPNRAERRAAKFRR